MILILRRLLPALACLALPATASAEFVFTAIGVNLNSVIIDRAVGGEPLPPTTFGLPGDRIRVGLLIPDFYLEDDYPFRVAVSPDTLRIDHVDLGLSAYNLSRDRSVFGPVALDTGTVTITDRPAGTGADILAFRAFDPISPGGFTLDDPTGTMLSALALPADGAALSDYGGGFAFNPLLSRTPVAGPIFGTPEPSSLLMAALGGVMMGMVVAARRRRSPARPATVGSPARRPDTPAVG